MGDYLSTTKKVQRESETEKTVRKADVSDLVEWIHELEDSVEVLYDALYEVLNKWQEDADPNECEDTFERAFNALLKARGEDNE